MSVDLDRKRRKNQEWYRRNRKRILAAPVSEQVREARRRRSEAWRRAHGIAPRSPAFTREQALARREAKRRAQGVQPQRRGRQWKRDPAENRDRVRAWRKANPEKVREAKRRTQAARRARKLGAYVESVDSRIVWQRDEGRCGICGRAADLENWHLDHVIPLARGGEHSYANVQVSHPSCNLRKSANV